MYLHITDVTNLPDYEKTILSDLINVFNTHNSQNRKKIRYYEGHVTVGEVNLNIALPRTLRNLEVGCSWGQKCVDVLASRSMFDGFVGQGGFNNDLLNSIVDDNQLIYEYQKATRDELKLGATFATLALNEENKVSIRFHNATTAAALWDGEKGRIKAGLAIIDTVEDEIQKNYWRPSLINLYTDKALWVLSRNYGQQTWVAEYHPNKMGRPLMEPLVWDATTSKPFGRSRIKKPIRSLIDGYIRTVANATIALEFDTTPQKYLLGVSDEQYDAIISDKFKQYVGSILTATSNPETGENPEFGQLAQGNIEAHIQMLRALATQFSAATGLTVVDTGVLNDANPTSSDAILAQSQTLVLLAEQLNKGNANCLKNIALMALAMTQNKTIDELSDEDRNIVAHFKNPAMPSVSVTADAAIKIASSRDGFSKTDVFLEMIGFDQADIRRIKAQEQRVAGSKVLAEEFATEEAPDEKIEETSAATTEEVSDES